MTETKTLLFSGWIQSTCLFEPDDNQDPELVGHRQPEDVSGFDGTQVQELAPSRGLHGSRKENASGQIF